MARRPGNAFASKKSFQVLGSSCRILLRCSSSSDVGVRARTRSPSRSPPIGADPVRGITEKSARSSMSSAAEAQHHLALRVHQVPLDRPGLDHRPDLGDVRRRPPSGPGCRSPLEGIEEELPLCSPCRCRPMCTRRPRRPGARAAARRRREAAAADAAAPMRSTQKLPPPDPRLRIHSTLAPSCRPPSAPTEAPLPRAVSLAQARGPAVDALALAGAVARRLASRVAISARRGRMTRRNASISLSGIS